MIERYNYNDFSSLKISLPCLTGSKSDRKQLRMLAKAIGGDDKRIASRINLIAGFLLGQNIIPMPGIVSKNGAYNSI